MSSPSVYQHLYTFLAWGLSRSRGTLFFLSANSIPSVYTVLVYVKSCISLWWMSGCMKLFSICLCIIFFSRLSATLRDVTFFFHPCSNVPYGSHTGSDDCSSGSSVSNKVNYLLPHLCWGISNMLIIVTCFLVVPPRVLIGIYSICACLCQVVYKILCSVFLGLFVQQNHKYISEPWNYWGQQFFIW
jgi:hypothetical protein